MSFLLDTNIISQTLKPRPNEKVLNWLESNRNVPLFLSVITLAEIRDGIERMPVGKRRVVHDYWLKSELPQWFQGRILPVTEAIADVAGMLSASSRKAGFNIEPFDILIAATAQVHQLPIATLNNSHFIQLGATLAALE